MATRLAAVILAMVMLGCVKVQLQSETPQRRTEVSEGQGKDFRVQFAERMRNLPPTQKFNMTRLLIDSVTVNYLRYGRNIADQWRQASDGRGQAVSDVEIQNLVSNSNKTQEPLTQAYEESIDYGIDQIKQSQGVDPSLVGELESYRDYYYKLYNGVFFPKGTRSDYENRLSDLETEGSQISKRLSDAARQFR